MPGAIEHVPCSHAGLTGVSQLWLNLLHVSCKHCHWVTALALVIAVHAVSAPAGHPPMDFVIFGLWVLFSSTWKLCGIFRSCAHARWRFYWHAAAVPLYFLSQQPLAERRHPSCGRQQSREITLHYKRVGVTDWTGIRGAVFYQWDGWHGVCSLHILDPQQIFFHWPRMSRVLIHDHVISLTLSLLRNWKNGLSPLALLISLLFFQLPPNLYVTHLLLGFVRLFVFVLPVLLCSLVLGKFQLWIGFVTLCWAVFLRQLRINAYGEAHEFKLLAVVQERNSV